MRRNPMDSASILNLRSSFSRQTSSDEICCLGRQQSSVPAHQSVTRRRGNNRREEFIQADLSPPEQVKRIVPFALETFGRLDKLLLSQNHNVVGVEIWQREGNVVALFLNR